MRFQRSCVEKQAGEGNRARKKRLVNEGHRNVTVEPDYRLTCLFVDRNYRRKAVAGLALRGALDLIARAGGGRRPTRRTRPARRCRHHSCTAAPEASSSKPASLSTGPRASTTA
jgi:hypothetical protein